MAKFPRPGDGTQNTDAGGARSETQALGRIFSDLYGAKAMSLFTPDPNDPEVPKTPFGIFAAVPNGMDLVSVKKYFDEFAPAPDRRKGTAVLRDQGSFVDHVNRQKHADSAVFANPDRSAPKLVAVYDYNPQGGETKEARFMGHRASYDCQLSDEWKAWMVINGKALDVHTFAEFIEDRIADVQNTEAVKPEEKGKLAAYAKLLAGIWAPPEVLMELSRGLEVSISERVKQITTLATGEINIVYEQVHNTTEGSGRPIKVANLFLLSIPVFYRGPSFPIIGKLRYRLHQGVLTWTVVLHQPEKAFDTAFDELCEFVRTSTELPVFRGTAETQA